VRYQAALRPDFLHSKLAHIQEKITAFISFVRDRPSVTVSYVSHPMSRKIGETCGIPVVTTGSAQFL